MKKKLIILILGDALTLALVTLSGFLSHQTLATAGVRILATYLPLLLSWSLAAPLLGAYDLMRVLDGRQLWRPVWAMLLAAPLAGLLRGLWLGQVILPLFVVILGGISALAMLVWRILFWALSRRVSIIHG